MYYYKSPDQKRGNFKNYVILPSTVGSLSRTHKIMQMNANNERVQCSVMVIAYNANRSESQRNDRRAKR